MESSRFGACECLEIPWNFQAFAAERGGSTGAMLPKPYRLTLVSLRYLLFHTVDHQGVLKC
jgi:hypothetical protein